MNETRRKPVTGTRCPTLFDKWHGFYISTSTDTAGDTKAFVYLVMEHWGSPGGQYYLIPENGREPVQFTDQHALKLALDADRAQSLHSLTPSLAHELTSSRAHELTHELTHELKAFPGTFIMLYFLP